MRLMFFALVSLLTACQPATDASQADVSVRASNEQSAVSKTPATNVAPPSTANKTIATENSFGFAHSSAQLSVSEEFALLQRAVLAKGASERKLKITGLRYRDERSDPNMDLGTLRATALRLRFEPLMPIEQLDIESELVDELAPKQARFEAIRFEWVALTAPVPIIANASPVAFAFKSSKPIINAQFPELVAAFGQGGAQQRFEITGFYFDGESESLAAQRAQALSKAFAKQHAGKVTYLTLAQYRGAKPGTEPFEAASFRWID
jgi:hypothetical protein